MIKWITNLASIAGSIMEIDRYTSPLPTRKAAYIVGFDRKLVELRKVVDKSEANLKEIRENYAYVSR